MRKPAAFSDKCLGKRLKSATHVREDLGDMIVLDFETDEGKSFRMVVSSDGPVRVTARVLVPKPPRPRRL